MVEDSYTEEPTLPGAPRDVPSQPAISVAGGLATGDVIAGRYRLAQRIGAGAMGVVWQAEDTRLARSVAVKVLHPDAADADAASRMRHEAKLLAQIEHVNVVRVFDAGLTELGRPFVVMEHVRGESLGRKIVTEGAIAWPHAIELAIQIADGLVCAHDLGIIHRDLKPANVLVLADARGRSTPKIIDFGLAKGSQVGDRTRIPTRTGEVFGTPAYMSPEQVRGETVDVRTDIYAFGVMLFEMLSGRRLWQHSSVVEVLYAQLYQPAPLLRVHAPDVPVEIEAIVARCLAKQADARFADAHALRSALQGAGMRGATITPQVVAGAPQVVAAAPQAVAGTAQARPSEATSHGRGSAGWIVGGLAVAVAAGFAVTWVTLRGPTARAGDDVSGGDARPAADDARLEPPAVAGPPPSGTSASAPADAPTGAPSIVAPRVDALPGETSPGETSPGETSRANAGGDDVATERITPTKPRAGTTTKRKPEPTAKPEPAKPEPAKPEPAKPEPAKPEPAKPDGEKPRVKPKVGPSGTFDPFG